MATFDKLIQEIGSRYCLGSKAYPLVQGRRVRRRGCFLVRRT
jgi:hypothetical protein